MNLMRSIHRWIGLILGLQLFLWMLSGLVMGLLPHDLVTGHHYKSGYIDKLQSSENRGVENWSDSAWFDEIRGSVYSVSLKPFDDRQVYRVQTNKGAMLFDAQTGKAIIIDEQMARKRALQDYSGPGQIVGVSRLEEPSLAIRAHRGAAWRVDFDDAESTSVYLSAEDGRILERRNTYWRVFDIFWMLHIMDYQERANFNNTLIIIAALILLWMGISGIVIWGSSFKRQDFALIAKWKLRNLRHTLNIVDSEGGAHKSLSVRPMLSLFETMSAAGYPLPSSCGGGGTCGLCRVRIEPAMSISAVDRHRIPESELNQGYRLACQHRIASDATVILPHGLLDAIDYDGHISSTRFVTPYICELKIQLSAGQAMNFRAGSYVQIRVPPFNARLDQMDITDAVRDLWLASKAPTEFGTDVELFRTYSIANAPGELEGEIILNVRMAMPSPDKFGVPVGMGSAYLGGLKVGDPVSFRGPLGDFEVRDEHRELIFIGGGAGMGPLRSMVLDELVNKKSDAPISFWYGARTASDLFYSELFDGLCEKHPNFSWHIALSESGADDNWSGNQGYIHEIVRKQYLETHPDLSSCSFLVCGPPPMLIAVLKMLDELGVDSSAIAFDDFGI